MSSVKTSPRSSTSKKSSEKDKDLEIRSLKEEILRLKVTMDSINKTQAAVINMSMMRDDMKVADRFIKMVLRDNVRDYEMVVSMEKEDNKVTLKKKTRNDYIREQEKFTTNVLDKMNSEGCGCGTCMMNKNMFMKYSSSRPCMAKKLVQLEGRLYLSYEFNYEFMYVEAKLEDKKTKIITFKDKKTKNDEVKLKFFYKYDQMSIQEDIDFDFEKHKMNGLVVVISDITFNISFSSFIVVKSMRESKKDFMGIEDDMANKKEMVGEKDGFSCFQKWIMLLMPVNTEMEGVMCIDDLNEDLEMYFLSYTGNQKSYIRVNEENKYDKINHIQSDKFDGGKEINNYELVMPMFRFVHFYSDNDEDVLSNNPSDSEAIYRATREFTSIDKKIKEGSSKVDDYLENLETTMTNEDSLLNMYSLFNCSISNQLDKVLGRSHDMFSKKVFKDKNSNKGFDDETLNILFTSRTNHLFLDRYNSLDIKFLRLLVMPYKEFLCVLYYSRSTKTFFQTIFKEDMDKMYSRIKMIYRMFLEQYNIETLVDMTETEKAKNYMEFLDFVKTFSMFDRDSIRRSFLEYKKRVLLYITMHEDAKEMDFEIASMSSNMTIMNSGKKEIVGFLKMKSDFVMDSKAALERFQPQQYSKSEFNPDTLMLKEVDISLSNDLLKEIRDNSN